MIPPRQNWSRTAISAAAVALALSACTSSEETPSGTTTQAQQTQQASVLMANARSSGVTPQAFSDPACEQNGSKVREGGRVYSVNLQSASGETIAFSVFEPANIDCQKGNPLVLHGHGYGGSRETTPSGNLARFVEAGAGVISIDQRGFGESSGSVRVMDPDFEGQDLLQILDWAEANLDWLRYARDESTGGEMNMVAGSTGGSYGGGYQLLIHNIDPKHRLDALTPDITWNDLRHSLNPGAVYGVEDYQPEEGQIAAKGTIKTGWALALIAGGEAGSIQNGGQDNLIRETLTRGALSNSFPDGALEFFRYHSPSYYCDPEVAGEQVFLQGTITPTVPQAKPAPVDILFTQGFRDTLFNFNDGFHNFACYRNLQDAQGRKADVRFFTHQSGHILPVSSQGQEPFESFAANGANFPEFQTAGGPAACGQTSLRDAQFTFLVEKLFTKQESDAIFDNLDENTKLARQTMDANVGKACLSYDDTTADAVWVDEEELFVTLGPSAKSLNIADSAQTIEVNLPVGDPANAVTSGPVGIADYLPAPAMQIIEIPAGLDTLAGIPTATLDIKPAVEQLANPVCTELSAGASQLPTGLLGLDPACDPIIFVGLSVFRDGAWRLIDSQVTPVRGYGKRHVEMTGIAEKFLDGDQLALTVYGYHPQYVGTSSRDVLSPAVNLSGSVQLPWIR